MKALIKEVRAGNLQILKVNKWLQYLALTKERHINFERISSVGDIYDNRVLAYVCRTFEFLDKLKLSKDDKEIMTEVLKWCEVAKCGLPHKRAQWLEKGYNLFAHNLGSAEIYLEENKGSKNGKLIYTLIKTHGLVGQYLRGEVPLIKNKPLHDLITAGKITAECLKGLLYALNYCVIGAVDPKIWEHVSEGVQSVIDQILIGGFEGQALKSRLKALRTISIANGEDFEGEYAKLKNSETAAISKFIENTELWYVEAALYDFTFTEFAKILLLIATKMKKLGHISFELLMQSIYYDYKGKKRINVYKKRIIEKYLTLMTYSDILSGRMQELPHVKHEIREDRNLQGTYFFDFKFSPTGEKLIGFCVEAEKAGVFYEKAVILLFDLFDLRRDKFDRFNNEEKYLDQMNSSMNHKQILLNYITGKSILDIGPGSGGLMDLIEENLPDKKVTGVDFSQNVVEALQKRKMIDCRKWDIVHGNALELTKTFEHGEVDTVIFSSVLHELFSYIPFEGKKFNVKTVSTALKSAYDILPKGGRIIIRDGIKTAPENQNRILRFRSDEGLIFLQRYVKDFCGRQIKYEVTGHNEVIMPVNDAMEFLYTYTWGEESYIHEVQEQFGYFTPGEYKKCISKTLGTGAKIVEFKHFLQSGYTEALSPKVDIADESGNAVPFPDSTCIIVIEKN